MKTTTKKAQTKAQQNSPRAVRWLRMAEDAGACKERKAYFQALEAEGALTESEVTLKDAAWLITNAPADRLSAADVSALVTRVGESWDPAWFLTNAPADRLTPTNVRDLVARVTRPGDASWVLRDAPAGRLVEEDVHALVARVTSSWAAAEVLRYAPAGRLSEADRVRLAKVAAW